MGFAMGFQRIVLGAAALYAVEGLAAAEYPATATAETAKPPGTIPKHDEGFPRRLTAARASGAIAIDGLLSEVDWTAAPVAAGFRQIEPQHGAPASADTSVRILFDDTNLYVGAVCRHAGEPDLRLRDLRRDFTYEQSDVFGVAFDTLGDARNAFVFQVTPAATQRDLQVFDGELENLQWDGVWRVRTSVAPDAWTVEMEIPWRTLRYREGSSEWGVNFVRLMAATNETDGWSPWPRQLPRYRMDYAGRLEGLAPPPPSRNLRVLPYARGDSQRKGPLEETRGEIGGDLKWAITPDTVLDATANTDFAEVEVDRQVVNLTRFSVFLPEKRPFFLENASLYTVGLKERLEPFFSRRIGLDETGAPVAIDGGARITGRSASDAWGGLVMRQAESSGLDSSLFAVGRYTRNLGSGNRIGGTLVHREDEAGTAGEDSSNTVGALDAFLRPSTTAVVRGMLSGSVTEGRDEGLAGYLWAYNDFPWGYVGWIQEYIGEDYRADAGFVLRPNSIRTSPAITLDLRPSWKPSWVRRFRPSVVLNLYHSASDRKFQESRVYFRPFYAEFQNGGHIGLYSLIVREKLVTSFSPLPNVDISAGDYDWFRYGIWGQTNPAARFRIYADFLTGGYYDGRLHELDANASATVSPKIAFALSWYRSWLRKVGAGAATRTAEVFAPEVRLALDPRLQLSVFYQRNTAVDLGTWNARLAWEFRPLSFLHLVYNNQRPQEAAAGRDTRQLVLKATYLLQL